MSEHDEDGVVGTPGGAQPREVALDALRELGVSTHGARTFLALVRLDGGTAKAVSEVVEVPRTRVYDAISELQAMGLVDVQHSSPKRFAPVSAETAGRRFRRE